MNNLKTIFFFLLLKICSLHLSEQRISSRNNDFFECIYKDTAHCSDVKFTALGFQCCKNKINQESKCFPMISPIKLAQEEVKTENGKILVKEYFGYSMFNGETPQNLSTDYECPDGTLSIKYELKDFSPEEQEKLKSQKHCIKYNEEYSGTITKDICYKADLATTGNSGVSCGYYEFDIMMTDKSTYKHQTCFLFNDDIRTTKNIAYSIKQMAELEAVRVANEQEKELSSYQMKGTNSKDKYFIYYSLNDTVGIPNSGVTNISFINSRYIVLLILFCIFSY